jgi:hypothetical protein
VRPLLSLPALAGVNGMLTGDRPDLVLLAAPTSTRHCRLTGSLALLGGADQPARDDDGRFRASQRRQATSTAEDTSTGTVQPSG